MSDIDKGFEEWRARVYLVNPHKGFDRFEAFKAGAEWQAAQSTSVEHFCDNCQAQASAIPRALGWECVRCGIYYSNPQPPQESE